MSFLSDLGATLIGVFVGAILALVANRIIENEREKINEKNLIKLILIPLLKNEQLFNQLIGELSGGTIPYYNLELSGWQIFSTQLYLLKNKRLTKKIYYRYYEISHLSRKIDKLFSLFQEIVDEPQTEEDVRLKAIYMELLKKTISHLQIEVNNLSELIKDLKYSLDKK